ncbi:aminotransferase class III-fold pyridoxal phosphate-dependent enzyme [Nocardia otitidiscaviarum]|nr:aminotransferase class III-fold pyridoxal phosphate-dependent enzyme [Nocardia otitidiscaviarum]MCP9619081.1 aminotransferase class III-fold pyridoxal phosphate-dependent enzyme [Nocardia otitidiscaviarum]
MADPSDVYGRYARPEITRLLRAFHLDADYRAAEYDTLVPATLDGGGGVAARAVLDLVGGHGAGLFGHNHPALIRAAETALQARRPFAVQGSVRAGAARLSARLSALVGASTGAEYVVTLASTGAEAVEAAVKHAALERSRYLSAVRADLERTLRRARRDGVAGQPLPAPWDGSVESLLAQSISDVTALRERAPLFVALTRSFHGKTAAAAVLTDRAADDGRPMFGPEVVRLDATAPNTLERALDGERITFCDISFGPSGTPVPTVRHASRLAACFVEPVQGEGGVYELSDDVLRAVRALADRHRAALVFDEIQSGMGRTGTFLAAEPSGVHADYYLLSKALGGGLAKISALLVQRDRYLPEFGRQHTSTFAEDDYSSEIACTALDLIPELLPRIAATGTRLRDRLHAVADRRPDVIAGVRGRGLLLAVELRPPRPASPVLRAFLDEEWFGYLVAGHLLHRHGIRVLPTLSAPATLRVQPSAYLGVADIDRIATAFEAVADLLHRADYAALLDHLTLPAAHPTPLPTHTPDFERRRPEPATALDGPPRVAFLANLEHPGDLRLLAPELAAWSDHQCEALMERLRGVLRPFEVTRQRIRSVSGAEVEVAMIAVPFSAQQAVTMQRDGEGAWLRDAVLDAVDLAIGAGAGVIGLGGYTSIVTDAARAVVEDTARITSGNSLTAACAYELMRRELAALPAGERRVAVVGAIGNIGAVMAELLLPHVDSLLLVGRRGSARRLRAVAERLGDPDRVAVREDMTALRDCRLIVTATNAATPVLTADQLPTDHPVLVYDLAVPGDVDPGAAALPGVTVLSGGRMRLPDGQVPDFPGTKLPPGTLYACMAETIALGFEPDTPSPSYGALTVAGVRAAAELARRQRIVPAPPAPRGVTMTVPMLLGAPDFRVEAAGGKAATLHELSAAGFPVPPGFVIPGDTDPDLLTDAELDALIAAVGGYPVAVRSSGVLEDLDDASFAGQYETYLEIGDRDALRRRIADCRASAHNDRVRGYLERRGFDPARARVAVLVQRMVESRTAGVGFTIDPITGREEHAVVECCAGLGERLVSGHVTPLRLTVRLVDGTVVQRSEGDEPVLLDAAEIAELTRMLLRVQAFRHRPQDVEWAVGTDGRLWLLQSRAVTAIAWRTDIEQLTDADFRDGGVSARVCTPLMFSLYENAFQASMQRFFTRLGLLDDEPAWMAMHYGRAYWNVAAVKRAYAGVPGYDERIFDADLGVNVDYGPDGPDRTPTNALTVARAVPTALALRRLTTRQLTEVERFAGGWEAKYARWRERAARLPSVDTATFTAELVDCLLSFHATTERAYFTTIYHNTTVQSDFKTLLAKIDAATDGSTQVLALIGGLAEVSHMAMQRGIVGLYRVADAEGLDGEAWRRALREFLDEHGFHADMELDITCPRWSEEPARVRAMIASMLAAGTPPADPERSLTEQRARFDAEAAAVRARVRTDPRTRVRFARSLDRQLALARRYLVARELMRDFSSRCYAIVRAYVVEAGTRLHAAGALADPADVYMLDIHEIADLAQGFRGGHELAAAIRYRRAMFDGYRDLVPPHELGPGVTVSHTEAGDGVLTGLGCSAGVVEGPARVIASLAEIADLRPGDILVTRFTDPGWTPALGLVTGVVTEVGGLLSHAAVIGREYGIPAVLNVPGATAAIRSGQRLRIDGGAGTVTLLDTAPPERDAEPAPAAPRPVAALPDPGSTPTTSRARSGGALMTDRTYSDRPTVRTLSPRKRMICIAGGDGSGKTTQVARLASVFESQGQTVAAVTIWDAFLDPAVSAKLPFDRPDAIYGYLKVLTPLSRTHFLYHAMQLALDLAARRGPDVVLMNSYWYKYFATEVAHGGDPAVLRALASGFPEPDLTFHLRISPRDALARKRKRSDYESGYGDEHEFLEFQQRSHDALAGLSAELGWTELDGTAPAGDITTTILEQLRSTEQ